MNKANANLTQQKMAAEAVNAIRTIVDENRSKKKAIYTADAMQMAKAKPNSTFIRLALENNNATDNVNIVLGTPIGIATEYEAIPMSDNIPNIMFDYLADMSDNQGPGLNFLQQLNKRFVRNAVLLSYIEVIVPDNATGTAQKAISPTMIEVPYNSASDSCVNSGLYNATFTEYTGVSILAQGYILSDFTGFYYEIPFGSKPKLNIHIAAIDNPVFVV